MSSTESTDAVDHIIQDWENVEPGLDVSAMQIFGRLHRNFLMYNRQIAHTFEEFGINSASFDVLAALRRAPEFTAAAGDLAENTLVTTGGLTLRVRRLEEQGLVTRSRDDLDNRVVRVRLTAKGRKLVDRVAAAHFANLGQLLGRLTPAQIGRLEKGLRQLDASMSASATYPAQAEEA